MVRLWGKCIDWEDARHAMNNSHVTDDPQVLGQWTCSEGAGTQVWDSSGKANHAVLEGEVERVQCSRDFVAPIMTASEKHVDTLYLQVRLTTLRAMPPDCMPPDGVNLTRLASTKCALAVDAFPAPAPTLQPLPWRCTCTQPVTSFLRALPAAARVEDGLREARAAAAVPRRHADGSPGDSQPREATWAAGRALRARRQVENGGSAGGDGQRGRGAGRVGWAR